MFSENIKKVVEIATLFDKACALEEIVDKKQNISYLDIAKLKITKENISVFHYCIKNNKINCLKDVLLSGVNPDEIKTDYSKKTGIFTATENNNLDAFNILIGFGANINAYYNNKNIISESRSPEIITSILKNNDLEFDNNKINSLINNKISNSNQLKLFITHPKLKKISKNLANSIIKHKNMNTQLMNFLFTEHKIKAIEIMFNNFEDIKIKNYLLCKNVLDFLKEVIKESKPIKKNESVEESKKKINNKKSKNSWYLW